MTKDIIKKAVSLAEKEAQEKEINRIKEIVQSYLEEIDEKNKKKQVLDKDIRILKKDLDDIKSGRLDKIEERQEKDKRAREVSLIIVHRIEKEYIPMTPWHSPFEITWNPWYSSSVSCSSGSGGDLSITGGCDYVTTVSDSCTSSVHTYSAQSVTCGSPCQPLCGTTFSKFSSGAYDVGGQIVNL